MNKIRIGVLVSGGGSNLQAIIDACEAGRIPGKVVFVGSDNFDAYGLERAKRHNIPAFVVNYRKIARCYDQEKEGTIPDDFNLHEILEKQRLFPQSGDPTKLARFLGIRASAERALIDKMNTYPFDLLVLAGFMRTLSPYFIDRINMSRLGHRIMNIHPALLPAFPGTDGYGDTFRYGCRVGGCTVHFVDYGEDSGPIIGQKAFEIAPGDTLETIKEKGLHLEWELYEDSVRLFAEGRLKIIRKVFDLKRGRKIERTIVEIEPNLSVSNPGEI
ncbi:MAG: phosphoribosylglycinamide formyltransferase [Desulfobacterales bacterium]|nr:phosphoribosylglycinamide formyltransferase [Desulfobacterales bacterium]